MTDQAFEDTIFAGVASIHKRAALLTHNVLLLHKIKGLEEEIAQLRASAQAPSDTEEATRRDERQRIAAWIDRTNEGDTVRAKYARKVAEILRSVEALDE